MLQLLIFLHKLNGILLCGTLVSSLPLVYLANNLFKSMWPVLWPPHAKSWLIGKDSDVGRDWGQEEKGMTEDEMAGWHHWLDGRESQWTPGIGDGQGGLACCNSWGRKESDTTKRLIWSDLMWAVGIYYVLWIKIRSFCIYFIAWIVPTLEAVSIGSFVCLTSLYVCTCVCMCVFVCMCVCMCLILLYSLVL